ncbi:hypothetical protein QBC46DRAFT_445730 [Diplogelasinospora grovesii]|uniref:Carrier domain-containing protein n=1 Tax=Diplogelasinospora grovesii TaxID=303347 RepID=A0AAN6NHE8_9PEZI|nr:hypothetical protein QBC46DRAFT_445730 [Diplogelasinospora grovesii]
MASKSSETLRLKSVKLVFDISHGAPFDGQDGPPQNMVFETPFPYDVPGIPKRFVFESPRPKTPYQPDEANEGDTVASPDVASANAFHLKKEQQDFWKSRLVGARSVPFPKLPSPSFQIHPQNQLVGGNCAVGKSAGTTAHVDLAPLVSTAWALVLSCQTDSRDVIFGLSVSETRLNAHPVRVSVDRQRPVSDVLNDVAVYAEQVRSSRLRVDDIKSLSDDAQAACSFQNVIDFGAETDVASERVAPLNYPLVLGCSTDAHGGELTLSARFDERIISRELARFLLSDLEHVLWQISGPGAARLLLKDIEVVGLASQRHMVRLNRPLQPKLDCLLHHLIADQVAKHPHAPAIQAWDGSLTYTELDTQSDRLAGHLSQLGVGPEVLVPILFEKSVLSVIAMLGVVKAGGAIIPLDPRLPLSRLHTMVLDAKAPLVISSASCRGKLPSHLQEVVLDDTLLAQLEADLIDKSGRPSVAVHPDNALYVMFTSGSTGKPKGVVVSHASFCSSSNGYRDSLRLASPHCRVLQYASFAFDASILEIFTTLTVGGCICIPSDADRLDNLAQCIVDLKANWAVLTPSVARLLRPTDVSPLEVLCLAGEALPQDVADKWADHVLAVNAYGPAEAAIAAVVSDPLSKGAKRISLGRPRNCAVWVVNEDGDRLAPFNAVGEIVIEGPGVSRGYLGDAMKTAAVFGEDADFLKTVVSTSSRFYRTGDLGRLSPDGTIDYLGRKDAQVKINGQRVETGEIEQHVKSFLGHAYGHADETGEGPGLDIVVELLQPANGDRKILAVFVGLSEEASQEQLSTESLILDKQHPTSRRILELARGMNATLSEKLPAYMIPRIVLPCRCIPKSPSGKTDRKRLRDIGNAMSLQQQLRMVPQLAESHVGGVSAAANENSQLVEAIEGSLLTTRTQDVDDAKASSPTRTETSTGQRSSETGSEASSCATPPSDLTASEQFLRKIWADVLELPEESILPDDDFFRLGGNSIGAIEIVAACRRASVRLSTATIANTSVLRDMALACQPFGLGNGSLVAAQRQPFSLLEQGSVAALREEAAAQCEVEPGMIEDLYPCTAMQEGLMAANLTRLEGCMGRFIHKLAEDVDVPRFKNAWEDVLALSPVLRTRFASTMSAGSLQAVIKERPRWLTSHALEAYLEADDAKPMLPGSPLTRFALVQAENGKTAYFVWTMHHMLYDAWSFSLICRRVNAMYGGVAVNPPADFRNFVAYERRQDKALNAAYWQKKLAGVAPSTFPAPVKPGHVSLARATVSDYFEFPQTGNRESQRSGLTLSTVIQAAWAIMISHYSKTGDVLFGTTVSGRNAPVDHIEDIEGPTITTVPVRLRVHPDSRAIAFLRHVQDHYAAMIPYEQTGIQAIRAINEDTKRGCDFQNLLLIQAGPAWDEDAKPLGMPSHRGEGATVPLLCEAWLRPDGIEFTVDIDEAITSRVAVAEAITMVKVVLEQLLQVSESSAVRLADIRLKKEASEKGDDNYHSSSPWALKAVHSHIHELIFNISKRQWLDEAVCSSQASLSYQDLDRLSSNLALHLLALGVEKGAMLPLCFEKSIWTVVAMLAALKAGAAFVPLDPGQPLARLRELVAQVQASFVLTSPLHAKATDLGASVTRVVVDAAFLQSLRPPTQYQLPRVSPDDLAYVVFTSGSTGRPKGVMISHSAFASSATAYGEVLRLAPKRRVLQFSAYSFDASLNEILTTLMCGGTVCVASERERIEDLAGFMRRTEVDWAILTPSVARLLSPADVPLLRTLDLGGEAPDGPLLSKWHQAGVQVFNVYGPAEAACTSTCQRYGEGVDPRAIGAPMGCLAWVVEADDHDKLVADGQPGELVIEGPTLATGYLKDDQKTASSFISNPKWAQSSSAPSPSPRRMYKTGDVVFRNSDDNALVYIGRKDLQVKLHGQRIELGDIEANLATCAGVRHCAVLFPTTGPFKQRLTAVIELDAEAEGNNATPDFSSSISQRMRAEVAAKVPAFMVPTHWVNITTLAGEGKKTLPLNSSGKVDRRRITSWLEEVSTAKAEQLLDASGEQAPRDVTGRGELILETEHPAYALAETVFSMLPPRARGSSSRASENGDGPRVGFDNVLLHSSGLDSLNMMSLMYFISRQFHVKVDMQLLMSKTTSIRSLAGFVSESSPQQQVAASRKPAAAAQSSTVRASIIEVMAEISRHDSGIAAAQRGVIHNDELESKPKSEPLTVLLTGANGFIGTQILRQLLEHDRVGRVVAVVRGQTADAARSRTVDAARRALWWTDFHGEKLEVWPGDLSLPHLGLEPTCWDRLADGKTIDVVIHNGAAVHWAKSYAALEATNVHSTVELLRLAVTAREMRFVYVSGGRESDSSPDEEREEDVAEELSAADAVGYSQTKFVAEALVKRAALRCCCCCRRRLAITRPGLVIGTPTEGVANADDYIWRLAAACIRAGTCNADEADAWVYLSDAAAMAAAIINAALGTTTSEVVTQVRDGMTWGQFWSVLRGMGYRLEARGAAEWLAAVRADIEVGRETHPLWPLAHMLESQVTRKGGPQADNDARRRECGDTTPLRLKVAVRRSADFLARVGFLPRPTTVEAQEATQATHMGPFLRSGL